MPFHEYITKYTTPSGCLSLCNTTCSTTSEPKSYDAASSYAYSRIAWYNSTDCCHSDICPVYGRGGCHDGSSRRNKLLMDQILEGAEALSSLLKRTHRLPILPTRPIVAHFFGLKIPQAFFRGGQVSRRRGF